MNIANRKCSSGPFNQYKSSYYLLDNKDDNLTKKILSFKGGDIALREVYGNAKLIEEKGKNKLDRNGALVDDIIRNDYVKRNANWSSFALRRRKYPNSYLEQISNLLSQAKDYKHYMLQRKQISSSQVDSKMSIASATPSKTPLSFYSIRTRNLHYLNSRYGKTRNGWLNKTSKSNKTFKIENKNEVNNYHNNNDESKEEDILRFDEGFIGFQRKIFTKLENENNFYRDKDKDKEVNANEFDLIKEKIYRIQNPINKKYYLRNEYFRSSFTKTIHLMKIRDKNNNQGQSTKQRNISHDLSKKFQLKDMGANKTNCHHHKKKIKCNSGFL